ncbi:MAG: SIMPL domain-containing protein [Candidatus Pacebacteria bacterium]|nr:SIMPL domain-containing protein [Candidatus Paceibacterota bacterium]
METKPSEKKESVGSCCGQAVWPGTRLQGSITLVLVLLAAFLFAQTINTLKEYRFIGGGVAPSTTISIAGEGEVFAIPDTAQFDFTVMREGATASEVQRTATEKVTELVSALKEKGVNEQDIKTVSYRVEPKYEWQPKACVSYPCDRKQVQTGFTLEQSFQVKVRALDTAGELLTLMSEKGATAVSNISFTLADEEGFRTQARKLAIEDAKKKAEQLAKELGVSVVRIVGFYESAGDRPMPYAKMMFSEQSVDAAMAPAPAAVVPTGENRFVSTVEVTYEIR